MVTGRLILALGSNQTGPWGGPVETLARAVSKLRSSGLSILRASSLFETRPFGPPRQPNYLNAVLVARCALPPDRLLRTLKGLEREAGRRAGPKWGPRPLDIDVIDYAGRVTGWPFGKGPRRGLVLPHPEAHRRTFVLEPLLEVAPRWRHPALGTPGSSLVASLRKPPGSIRRVLDYGWVSCHLNVSETAVRSPGVELRIPPPAACADGFLHL